MFPHLEIPGILFVSTYNLLAGIGLLFSFLYLDKEVRKYKISFEQDKAIYNLLIGSFFIAFLSAKLFELLYQGEVLNWANFVNGGFTFIGGLIGALGYVLIMNKYYNLPNTLVFNLLTPFVIILHFFGRIGCFLGGCCYGSPTDSILGVKYPNDAIAYQSCDIGAHLHPTPIYEAVFLLILFLIIRKTAFKLKFATYLIFYGITRFILEFFRYDQRGEFLIDILSPSQTLSILLFLVGLFLVIYHYKKVVFK